MMGALPSSGPAVANKDDAGYSAGPGKAAGKHKGGGSGQPQRSKSDSAAANPYFFGTK